MFHHPMASLDSISPFTRTLPILIHNRPIRYYIHCHDVFFQSHRILKIPLAIDELLETGHHEIRRRDGESYAITWDNVT